MKFNIRQKVTRLVLAISVMAVAVVSVPYFYSMSSMKSNSIQTSQELGKLAADDSKSALSEQAKKHISDLAKDKADYIELKFGITENYVEHISDAMTDIYSNTESYPDRGISEPIKDFSGLSSQLLFSSIVTDRTVLAPEISKIANIQDMLFQTVNHDPVVAASYVATKSGIVIMSDTTPEKKFAENAAIPSPYEAFTRPWYIKASEEQKLIFTDVIYDVHGGGPAIICAKPFYKGTEFMGVAGVGSFLTDINDLVMQTEIGETGYTFILNNKGQVNISPKTDSEVAADPDNPVDLRNSSNAELAAVSAKMTNGESGICELKLDGESVYLAYEPLNTLGWSFAAVISVNEVMKPANNSNEQIMSLTDTASEKIDSSIRSTVFMLAIITLIIVLCIIFISMKWSGKLSAPILLLTKKVHSLEGDDLENKIEINTGDEVEELAKSFNSMTEKLKAYISHLTRVTAEKERIGAELNVATQIQASMLPCIFPAFPDKTEIDIYAAMSPAKEVGGDFYDFFLIDDDHLCVVMADVSGKGVPAALFMVISKTLIKDNVLSGKEPKDVFTCVNEQLCENNEAGMFVTAFMGILELSSGKFTYVNAGHNAPLIKKANGNFEWLKAKPGFILAGMEGIQYRQAELFLESGDIFFTYTDGVTEALNPQLELYSDPRLESKLNSRETAGMTVEKLLAFVRADIELFADGAEQADDITMLGLQYFGKE